MNRFLGRLVAGSAVVAGAAVLTPACVHNDSTIFIRSAMAPPATSTNGACLYTADPTQPIISGGVLDVGLSSSYTAELLIGNQLLPRSSAEQVRTETSRVAIQGTTVRITDADGNQLASYTRLATGFIDPAAGTVPSYAVISATLVDPATASVIRNQLAPYATRRLVSYVKAFGKTLGGTDVESDEFQFPISVCLGCLVSFPPDSVDTAKAALTGTTNCLGAYSSTTSASASAAACVQGQDQFTDCRLCQGSAVCNPNYLNSTTTTTTTPSDAGRGG